MGRDLCFGAVCSVYIETYNAGYACVKSVLLYGCKTWLVTKEIQCKIQTLVNRCLRYILRIWWPNIISNKDLWKVTGQEDINAEIRKRKFIDGFVTHLEKKIERYQSLPYFGTLRETGREEDREIA